MILQIDVDSFPIVFIAPSLSKRSHEIYTIRSIFLTRRKKRKENVINATCIDFINNPIRFCFSHSFPKEVFGDD